MGRKRLEVIPIVVLLAFPLKIFHYANIVFKYFIIFLLIMSVAKLLIFY